MRRLLLALIILGATVTPAQAKIPGIGGRIQIICDFSHRNFDDAIVHPGLHNSTHEHGYVGSDSTDGLSTVASMEASSTSCGEQADTSGYWFPLLIDPQGRVYEPDRVLVYYNAMQGVTVNMVPEGLKMLAGGDTANIDVVNYTCGDNRPVYPTPKHCTNDRVGVVANIYFPDCIGPNGEQVYAQKVCPSGYLQIPDIHFDVRYPLYTGGAGWGLTSDAMKGMSDGRSLHADFWQTWSDQSVLANLIETCDNTGINCRNVGV